MSTSGPPTTQLGSTVCNRCGGRLMNPPSSPHTPLTASGPTLSSRSSQADSTSSHNSSSRKSNKSHGHRESSAQLRPDVDRRASRSIWKNSDSASAETKRRRLNGDETQQMSTSETNPYSLSSRKTYVSRPGVAYFRSHTDTSLDSRLVRQQEDERLYDPSLTLPPLKENGSSTRTQQDVETTVMTIPVLNKIKVLAKISPPLSDRQDSSPKGTVIAVDGQDPALVKIILKQLGVLLTKDGKYAVRVFEGPELRRRQSTPHPGQMGDATVDYLSVISAWHRISDEIVQFISSKPQSGGAPSASMSPRSSVPGSSRRTSVPPMVSSPNGHTNGLAQIPGLLPRGSYPIPVALVPRYQLSTADVFACSIPINDRYAPLDHWQWMASLWRACVGPDVTIHIRECDKEELDRYGSGNPVEIRLNEARTLIVRRTPDSAKDIEEKALRRIGFEVEDFLTR
jgi:HMG box factor